MKNNHKSLLFGFNIPKFIDTYKNIPFVEIKGTISESELNYDFKYTSYEYVYGTLENVFLIDLWNNRQIVELETNYNENNNYYIKKDQSLPEILKNITFNKYDKFIFIECNSKHKLYAYIYNKKYNGLIVK